jgi:hypothetical protein
MLGPDSMFYSMRLRGEGERGSEAHMKGELGPMTDVAG